VFISAYSSINIDKCNIRWDFLSSLASVQFYGEVLANLVIAHAFIQFEGAFDGIYFMAFSGPHRRDMFTAYLPKSLCSFMGTTSISITKTFL